MGGEAVPQRMNADPLGDAGTPGCQANDPMQLARATRSAARPRLSHVLSGLWARYRRQCWCSDLRLLCEPCLVARWGGGRSCRLRL